jgi:hypothetical protein
VVQFTLHFLQPFAFISVDKYHSLRQQWQENCSVATVYSTH